MCLLGLCAHSSDDLDRWNYIRWWSIGPHPRKRLSHFIFLLVLKKYLPKLMTWEFAALVLFEVLNVKSSINNYSSNYSNNYTIYCFKCHQLYSSCSLLIVSRLCSVANTKRKPKMICHCLKKNLGIIDLQCYNYFHYCLWCDLSSKFQLFATTFRDMNVRMQNVSKVDELKVSWVDSICKHIHKKCH